MTRPQPSDRRGALAPQNHALKKFWRFGALALGPILAPVIFLSREPLRLLLAGVAYLATFAALGCLFSIPLNWGTGASVWEPVLAAYVLGMVGGPCWWLRRRIPPMFGRDFY